MENIVGEDIFLFAMTADAHLGPAYLWMHCALVPFQRTIGLLEMLEKGKGKVD